VRNVQKKSTIQQNRRDEDIALAVTFLKQLLIGGGPTREGVAYSGHEYGAKERV
jgi:hypothetical protein